MEKLKDYVKLVEVEIGKTVANEVNSGLNAVCEHDLHVLFENRKHAKELIAEHEAENKAKVV